MTTTITFNQKSPEAEESPIEITEGETRNFVCVYWGVPSSVSVLVYRSVSGSGNGVATSGIFAAGTVTPSGNTAPLTAASGFIGRAEYVISVTATVNSEVFVKFFKVRVRKDEAM